MVYILDSSAVPKGVRTPGKGNYLNTQTKSQTRQGCQIKNYFLAPNYIQVCVEYTHTSVYRVHNYIYILYIYMKQDSIQNIYTYVHRHKISLGKCSQDSYPQTY